MILLLILNQMVKPLGLHLLQPHHNYPQKPVVLRYKLHQPLQQLLRMVLQQETQMSKEDPKQAFYMFLDLLQAQKLFHQLVEKKLTRCKLFPFLLLLSSKIQIQHLHFLIFFLPWKPHPIFFLPSF